MKVSTLSSALLPVFLIFMAFFVPGALAQQPVVADQLPGADWCAKVNYADQQVLADPTTHAPISGEIWVSAAAGNSACASQVKLSPNRTLRFTQGGTFLLSCAGMTTQSVIATINGQQVVFPSQNVSIIGTSGLILTLQNGCPNFSSPLQIWNSTGVVVRDLEINGNGNQQQSGEQDHDILVVDSNRVKILNNYLHDAQGDDVLVYTDSNMTAGCNDVVIEGNTFANIGRHHVALAGYGCNDFRVLGNHFAYGSPVTTSSSRGNAVHVEGEASGTGLQRITIAANTDIGAVGMCYSANAAAGNPIKGLVIENNQCSGTNSSVNASAAIVVMMTQDAVIGGNTIFMSGSAAGTDGIFVEEVPGTSTQAHRFSIHNNTIEGVSSSGIELFSASSATGTPQAFSVHDNVINGSSGFCLKVINNFADVDIHDNICTNLQAGGIHLESPVRFHIHHNTVRDFGLNGSPANGIELTCNSVHTALGPGHVENNRIGNATAAGKTGIYEDSACIAAVYVFHNDLSENATGISFLSGGYVNGEPPY